MNAQRENGQAGAEQLLSLLNAKPQIDLRHYWFIVLRRKWWGIAIIFLITLGSVIYALLFVRPYYEAASTIQVLPSRLLNSSMRQVTSGVSDAVDYRELQRKILSTDYLLQVVQRLDLAKDERAVAAAKALQAKNPAVPFDELIQRVIVDNLRKNINVTLISGSMLFQITVKSETPEPAYQIVKTLTDIFIDESKKNELRGIRGVREFSNEQLAIYQQKVDEAEEKLRQFKERLASNRARSSGIGGENIMRLNELVSSSAIAIADRQRRLGQLEQNFPAAKRKLLWADNRELAQIKAQIDLKLENVKKSMQAMGLQSNNDLTFNNELGQLRQECQRLLTSLIPRLYPNLDSDTQQALLEHQLGQIDLYILQSRAEIANVMVNGFVNSAAAEPADQLQLQRLEEEVTKNRRVYNLFFEQSRGTQIEEALQNSDANFKYLLIEPARIPINPVGGSKTQFVSLSFLASLIIGIGAIFGLEMLDQSIRSVEDVEQYLQLPVWGIIPRVSVPFKVWHENLKKLPALQGRRDGTTTPTPSSPDPSVKKPWTT
ncbi:MAG: GumC family protein [bacterium]